MLITRDETQTSALDPVHLLAKSFKLILLVGLIGAALGGIASQIIHPRWVAKMTIQLGQVSIPDAKGSLVPQPLENQLTAIERYNLPSFRLQVLSDLGLPGPDNGNKDSDLVFKSLKAIASRSPNVVNVEVSAYSRESAEATLESALKTFSAMHRKLFDQAISEMQSNQALAQTKLANAQRDYARIGEALKSSATSGTATSTSARDVLASNTATLINAQVLELQQEVAAYKNALGPLRS
jgi:capsular polysaccharide biosynthesis protein